MDGPRSRIRWLRTRSKFALAAAAAAAVLGAGSAAAQAPPETQQAAAPLVDAAVCEAVIDSDFGARFAWSPVEGTERYILCIASSATECASPDGPTAAPAVGLPEPLDTSGPAETGADADAETDAVRAGADAPDEPGSAAADAAEVASPAAAAPTAGSGPLWLVVPGPSTEIPAAALDRPALLEAFSGRTVEWTAAACAGERCEYSAAACKVDVPAHPKSPPPAPKLVAPVDLEVVSALAPELVLSWKPSTAALGYRVCVGPHQPSALAAACATGKATVLEGAVAGTSAELALPASDAIAGKMLRWTVAACNRAGCSWSRSGRRVSLSASPPAPSLVSPDADARVESPRPTLSWDPIVGAEHYKVCVTPPGTTCEGPRAFVRNVAAGGPTSFVPAAPLPPDRPMTWTVAACVAGRCRYAWPHRRFQVVGLSAPTLVSPADGAHVAESTVRFSWEPSAAADSYLLCAYDQDAASARGLDARAACNAQGVATRLRTRDTSAEMTLGGAGNVGVRYAWMVAACHRHSGDECIYQRRPRRLDVEARYTVRMRIEAVEVHDDCDAASPGDWVLSAIPIAGGRRGAPLVWPERASRSVSDGERWAVGQEVVIEGVRAPSSVALVVAAVDCDGDALHSLTVPLAGRLADAPEIVQVGVDCEGQQDDERAGESDSAGAAIVELSAEQWLAGGPHSVRSSGGECGADAGAFTVHVVVESSAEQRVPVLDTPIAAAAF